MSVKDPEPSFCENNKKPEASRCKKLQEPLAMSLNIPRKEWSWAKCNALQAEEFQALVIDYVGKTIVLKREENKWVLPGYLGGGNNYSSSYRPQFVMSKVREVVNSPLHLFLLRQVWREEKDVIVQRRQNTYEKAVVLIENLGKCQKLGNGYGWIPLQSAAVYHLFEEAEQQIKKEITWALKGEVPLRRLPWQRPGWLKGTSTWIVRSLDMFCNTEVVPPITVERSTPFGIIIVLRTTVGVFYLKCTSSYMNDAAYTTALARIVPKYVQEPTVVDVENQLMISRDYGTILEPFRFSKSETSQLTEDYAELQKQTIGHKEDLVEAGMPDFSPEACLKGMQDLWHLSSFKALESIEDYAVPAKTMKSWLPGLRGEINTLAGSGIPCTVTHNDLFFSNIYRRDSSQNFMFFDWVEAYFAHPFTTYMSGLDENVYLKQWWSFGTFPTLQKWLRAGKRVRQYILLAMRLREADNMEEPESSESLQMARDALLGLYDCYSED